MERTEIYNQFEELNKRASQGGGIDKIEKQHAAGRMTARERIEALLDKGTFNELDKFVNHRCTNFGMEKKQIPGDGMVTGYGNQVKETAKKHRKEKDTATSDEFLSGFTKEDKLIPVITITVYLGTKEWDGPRRLSDMFGDVDEELLPFIPDYRINLLAPREITDFTGFRTSIRQLFEVLQNAYDKEKMQEVLQNDEKFSNVDRETVEAINLFAGTNIDIDEKEEVIDMCKAWEEQKNEGREEGRELGERQKIISQIVKKLQKDKSVAEIADDLEEKEEVIAPIYEAALSMKPDYDVEKIYELLEKNKKLA